MSEAVERFLELPQGRIFLKDWRPSGDESAAPILLFHDSLGCVALWRDFPERLAAATGRRILAWDRLGFGRSDPFRGEQGLDFIAQEGRESVPQILEAVQIGDFIPCGHSVGGGMAIETAARFGARCPAAATLGAQAFAEARTLEGIRAAAPMFRDPAMLARLDLHHGGKAAWAVEAWVETWLAPEFAGWSLDAALAQLTCPVLAIHGGRDEYGSPEHARRIADQRGEAVVLPEAGHVLHREDPEGIARRIAAFLDEVKAA